jgi:CRP-like cAMP-binding protein
MDLFHGLTLDEMETVEAQLIHRTVKKGEAVLEEGERERDLCFLVRGSTSVKIRLPDTDSHKRVITLGPGAGVGEVAFLDGGARSADVFADEDSELVCLPHDRFLALQTERPEIAAKILTNIALQLAKRLRTMSVDLRAAEDR